MAQPPLWFSVVLFLCTINIFCFSYLKLYTTMSIPKLASLSDLVSYALFTQWISSEISGLLSVINPFYTNVPLPGVVLHRCSVKKLFLKISQNSQANTCTRVSSLIRLQGIAGLRPTTLLKKKIWHRCFPVNFVKFLKNIFFYWAPLVGASISLWPPRNVRKPEVFWRFQGV